MARHGAGGVQELLLKEFNNSSRNAGVSPPAGGQTISRRHVPSNLTELNVVQTTGG